MLYVHGATFPSRLSIAHRFDGFAWRDALCAAGFDVWGLDFQGFGHSDRYPEMEEVPDAHAAFCRTEDASATTCSQPGAASSLIIRTRAYAEVPSTGKVDAEYTKAVGKRFGQWVIDTAKAQYDQAWLDYQYEIGLRHYRSKKNKTDAGHTLGHIRARDLIAFSAAPCP